jgi:hypothetical protein
MIAVTALMFTKNPAFQMAIALLVLFLCYAAQVCARARLFAVVTSQCGCVVCVCVCVCAGALCAVYVNERAC